MSDLWPHQQEAMAFVDHKPAAMLNMIMRSGKSRVALELLAQRQARRVLILCPRSVVSVWPGQAERYSNLSVLPLGDGTVVKRARTVATSTSQVFAVNYDAIWRRPLADWALKFPWDALVCDESHRIKAPSGQASRFVTKLAKQVPFRLALTGTPMPHSPLDIFAQYRMLDESIYGRSYVAFRAQYAVMQNMGNFQIVRGYKNLDDLQEKFRRIAFTVGKEVLRLPEPLHIPMYCTLEAKGQAIYESLERDFYAEVEAGEITAANAMVKGLRLQQLTSGYGKLAEGGDEVQLDTAKQEMLTDLLDGLDEPVVVFCRFRHDLDTVNKVANKLHRGCLELSGRANHLEDWQRGQVPILAVQTQAGGVGIDLSRARVAIYYSLGLSLGDHEQSQFRFLARDQELPMTYYYLLAENSIDGKVYRALAARKDVIEAILRRD